jgi:hypothetical protein
MKAKWGEAPVSLENQRVDGNYVLVLKPEGDHFF